MSLQSDAAAELNQVTVTTSAPYLFPGAVWNTGESAFMSVTIRNTSGMVLRDVVAKFEAYYPASVFPVYWYGQGYLDGEEYWEELQPGDVKTFLVRLNAAAAGTAHTHVRLSAEVVPYASRFHAAYRDVRITAA